MAVVTGIHVDHTRTHENIPTHRYTSLLWQICFCLVPLDIACDCFCLGMFVHESSDVRKGIDVLASELPMTKQAVLVP